MSADILNVRKYAEGTRGGKEENGIEWRRRTLWRECELDEAKEGGERWSRGVRPEVGLRDRKEGKEGG